jgi:hypothetical protein
VQEKLDLLVQLAIKVQQVQPVTKDGKAELVLLDLVVIKDSKVQLDQPVQLVNKDSKEVLV